MKHFSLMIGAIVALVSCSKSDLMPIEQQSDDQLAIFQVEAPATRAAVNGLKRYIVEAYEGKDLTTAPVRVETETGSLTVILKKNTDYTFLFWADKGTAKTQSVESSGYWNTDDLRAIEVSSTKRNDAGEVAYCCKLDLNSKDLTPNHIISLRNATAQVIFVEGAGLETVGNTLKVTYAEGATLNVGTGQVTDVTGQIEHTFTGIEKAVADAHLAYDYVLAPLGAQNVLNIKVQFNAEPEKTISNVPFQQNYKTNIKGEYSNLYKSIFDISNDVEDYDDDEVIIPSNPNR